MVSVQLILNIALSLSPVFVFLSALVFLDSYKLVNLRSTLRSIFVGCVSAACAMGVYSLLVQKSPLSETSISRYIAPLYEEGVKALFLVYLIKSKKVGFMVDAAIHGFALGAGFGFVENIYYLSSLNEPNVLVWIIRGFGTAVMHGGTTAIFGIVAKNLSDVRASEKLVVFLPGFLVASIVHSLFNHFLLPPLVSTLLILITLPLMMLVAFSQSEKATRTWLGVGFDNDAELLTMITSGNISQNRIGEYLDSIQHRFRGEIVADLLCYLRIYLELAIQAKGILLLRESGFDVAPDSAVESKFTEMKYLEKSVGRTGLLALSPFLHTGSRELWQLHTLRR